MCIIKELSSTIDFISSFQQNVKISGLPFTDRNAQLSINDRELSLDFQLTTEEALKSYSSGFLNRFYVISNNEDKYVVPDQNGVLNGSINLGNSDAELQNYNIRISRLMNGNGMKKRNTTIDFFCQLKKFFGLAI